MQCSCDVARSFAAQKSPRHQPRPRPLCSATFAHHSMATCSTWPPNVRYFGVWPLAQFPHLAQARSRQNLANSTPSGKCLCGATIFLVISIWPVDAIEGHACVDAALSVVVGASCKRIFDVDRTLSLPPVRVYYPRPVPFGYRFSASVHC